MAWDGAVEAMSDEDRLNALDAGGVGAWRWDAAGSVFQLSPRACALVGAQKSRVPYPEFLALLHPEDCSAFDLSFRATHSAARGLGSRFPPRATSLRTLAADARAFCGGSFFRHYHRYPRAHRRDDCAARRDCRRVRRCHHRHHPRGDYHRMESRRRGDFRLSAGRDHRPADFPFFCCRTRGRSTTAFSAA